MSNHSALISHYVDGYKVVADEDPLVFADKVGKSLREGWKLYGNPFTQPVQEVDSVQSKRVRSYDVRMCQAMVHLESDK